MNEMSDVRHQTLEPRWAIADVRRLMSLHIPQYLFGSRDVREEHAVAEAVEGLAQRGGTGGRGAGDRRHTETLGQPVLGGQPINLAAPLVVVGEGGPARARASRGAGNWKQAPAP